MEKIREECVVKWASISRPYVILNEKVLDLSDFLEFHPGGSAVLLANLGRDVTADFRHVPAHAHHGVLRKAEKLAVATVDRTDAGRVHRDVLRLLDYLRLVLNSFLVLHDPQRDPMSDVVYVGQIYSHVVGDHLPTFLEMISELTQSDVDELTPQRLARINEVTLIQVGNIILSDDRMAASALAQRMRENCSRLLSDLLTIVADTARKSLVAAMGTNLPGHLGKALVAAQEWTREEHDIVTAG